MKSYKYNGTWREDEVHEDQPENLSWEEEREKQF